MSSDREPTRLEGPRACSVADALSVIGDRWALLAIREIGFGVTRFSDILTNTGAPRASLSARLRDLEAAGLVYRSRYSDHPPRDEYLLTDAGAELAPVLGALRRWGARWASPDTTGQTGDAPAPTDTR